MSFDLLLDHHLISERYVPPVKLVEKYKDDPNMFISFTSVVHPRGADDRERYYSHLPSIEYNKVGSNPKERGAHKIGVNPKSAYGTPIGVYCYPVKELYQILKDYDNIPFVKEAPIVWFIRPKDPEMVYRASTYTEAQYLEDKDTLQEIFPNFDMDKLMGQVGSHYKTTPFAKFWQLTRCISRVFFGFDPNDSPYGKDKIKCATAWTKIMMYFCDGMVDDTNSGTIHSNEKTQAVFWTKAHFDIIDKVDRTQGGLTKHISSIKDSWTGTSSLINNEKKFAMVLRMLNSGKLPNKAFLLPIKNDPMFRCMFYAYKGNFEKMEKYVNRSWDGEKRRDIFKLYVDNIDKEKDISKLTLGGMRAFRIGPSETVQIYPKLKNHIKDINYFLSVFTIALDDFNNINKKIAYDSLLQIYKLWKEGNKNLDLEELVTNFYRILVSKKDVLFEIFPLTSAVIMNATNLVISNDYKNFEYTTYVSLALFLYRYTKSNENKRKLIKGIVKSNKKIVPELMSNILSDAIKAGYIGRKFVQDVKKEVLSNKHTKIDKVRWNKVLEPLKIEGFDVGTVSAPIIEEGTTISIYDYNFVKLTPKNIDSVGSFVYPRSSQYDDKIGPVRTIVAYDLDDDKVYYGDGSNWKYVSDIVGIVGKRQRLDTDPMVGDIIKHPSRNKIYKITDLYLTREYLETRDLNNLEIRVEDISNGAIDFMYPIDMVKATDEEIENMPRNSGNYYRIGDTVECIDNNEFETYLEIGKQYKVISSYLVEGEDYIKVESDGIPQGNYSASRFKKYKKPSPSPSIMSQFAVGDTLRCIDNKEGAYHLTIGNTYTIKKINSTTIIVTNDEGWDTEIYPTRFEKVEEKTPEVKNFINNASIFVPGIKVECIDNSEYKPYLTIGKIYEVISYNQSNINEGGITEYIKIANDNGNVGGYNLLRFKKVEDEAPSQLDAFKNSETLAPQKDELPLFEVGDKFETDQKNCFLITDIDYDKHKYSYKIVYNTGVDSPHVGTVNYKPFENEMKQYKYIPTEDIKI